MALLTRMLLIPNEQVTASSALAPAPAPRVESPPEMDSGSRGAREARPDIESDPDEGEPLG